MYKSMWEWLEIEPTDDKELIRKAYAEQVKKYHPEEHPEEAKALREAYKNAMKKASSEDIKKPEINIPLSYKELQNGEKKWDKQEEAENKQEHEGYTYKIKSGWEEELLERTATVEKTEKVSTLNVIEQGHLSDFIDKMLKLKKHKYCNYIEAWQIIFENHIDPNDFYNADFTEEVINVLGQMNRMGEDVWQYLEAVLFTERRPTEKWAELRKRFGLIKAELNLGDTRKAKRNWIEQRHIRKHIMVWVYGEDSQVCQKYKRRNKTIKRIIVVVILIMLEIISNYDKLKKIAEMSKETEDYNEMVRQSAIEYYRKQYTKDTPYLIDLNNDRKKDKIYYELSTGQYLVEFYSSEAGGFEYYGTLDDYLEKNPNMKELGYLDRLVSGY